MLRNFKNRLLIKTLNLGAMFLETKFGQIANILEPNKIKSSKQNFLDLFKCYI